MTEVRCPVEQPDVGHAGLCGSQIEGTILSGMTFSDANLSRLTIKDATMPGAVSDDANIAETKFENTSPKGGPVVIARLSPVTVNNCNVAGPRIDQVEIAPLLAQRKAATNG